MNDYYDRRYFRSGNTLRLLWWALRVMVCSMLIGCLYSCKSIEYVPVETVRTDTVYKSKIIRDSVWLHDSIRVEVKGDSVIIERWHTKYVDRLLTDTIYRSKTDSIQVPVPVERKLTTWERVCIDYGKLTMGATALLVVFIIVWLARKFKLL